MKTYPTPHLLIFLVGVLFSYFKGHAQEESTGKIAVSGYVKDSLSGEALVGATLKIPEAVTGTMTGLNGSFKLEVPEKYRDARVIVTYMGYTPKTVPLRELEKNPIILLSSEGIALKEIKILASVVEEKKTPLAVTRIKLKHILETKGAQEFTEIMKYTPSVYTSREGGGYGDSRISVRGFEQENVAVMINGVPVNDMENGRVYWSNWAGLADIAQEVQIQRGIGNARMAINSVGGTINIVTAPSQSKQGGFFRSEISNIYNSKVTFAYNSGLGKKGWAFTVLGSRAKGDGFVKGTDFEAWNYYVAISKDINASHRLTFTATGAPQWHFQRFTQLTKQDIEEKKDYWFNYDYGYLDGKRYGMYRNFYHKPIVYLNHYWTISEKSMLSTSFYVSFGRGGGSGILSKRGYRVPRRPDGLIDWEQIRVDNRDASVLDTIVVNGDTTIGYTGQLVHRNSKNEHEWYGVVSNYQTKLGERVTLNAGIDLRYYQGDHYREIKDLLFADFWVDSSNVNDPNPIRRLGDRVVYDFTSNVYWYGGYVQTQIDLTEKLTAILVGSVSNVGYQRIENFAYKIGEEPHISEVINILGYTAKGGLNYQLSEKHGVFVNGGYYSRAPFFQHVFVGGRYGNEIAKNFVNEKILTGETGYKFFGKNASFRILGYYILWKDKALMSSPIALPDGSYTVVRLTGLNAEHKGIEMEGTINLTSKLMTGLNVNLGDWRWQEDVTGVVTDINGNPVDTINLYIKGLPVGNSAQTQIGGWIRWQPSTSFFLQFGAQYFDRLYANFDPTRRTDPNDTADPWKLPSYVLADFNAGYNFPVNKNIKGQIFANVNNVFNTKYIVTARDGRNHDYETSTFFYGLGRVWNLGLSLNF